MIWLHIVLGLALFLGILLMIFSHGSNKMNMILGLSLIFASLLIWAFVWFMSIL